MKKNKLLNTPYRYKEQDPKFYGQELSYQYKKGPIQKRKFTDIFCCIAFFAIIAAMGYMGVLGYQNGDPSRLAVPFDEDGKQCGEKDRMNHTKIFISYFKQPLSIHFVCVKNCPLSSDDSLQCIQTSQVKNCSDLKLYASQTIVNLCFPNQKLQSEVISSIKQWQIASFQKYISDLKNGWLILLLCVFLSLITSLIFTLLIRYFAGCFVWTVIILFLILMIGIGVCSYLINQNQFLKGIVHYDDLPSNLKDRNYQIGCAVICWVLAMLEFFIACCFYRQIKVSIGILKAAADFTRQQCHAILIPVYVTIMQVIFITMWLVTILYVFSSSKTLTQIQGTPFGFVQFDTKMIISTVVFVGGLLWVGFFLQALGMYWTCSTIAIWYFESGDPSFPICRSIRRSLKQIGSLAFGAFILAVMIMIRITLEFITKILKKKTLYFQQEPPVIKFALKCVACFIACFQRLIRFLTSNAYIMMAISGKGFCESASESFYLVLKSTAQFAISHGTTKIFIVFGKLMIVAVCCLCGYLSITLIDYYKKAIYSPVFITIFFGIVSYPIASAFLSLFQMASNTILICYCLELDLSSGINQKCPLSLRKFLKNYVSQLSEISQQGLGK